MPKNSFTSNFNRRSFRYLIVLTSCFYGMFFLSTTLFLYKPHLFYWRAWEFFHEIVYNTPDCKKIWSWTEKGDLSRQHIFSQQMKWVTTVSCDSDGFRSVPFHAEEYPILVVGDSQIWGSGLSDDETLPWQLAKALNTPVFNGAKSKTETLLTSKKLENAKLVIEMYQSSILTKNNFHLVFNESFEPQPYRSCKEELQTSFQQLFTPKRYFIPFKIFRSFSPTRILRSLWSSIKHETCSKYNSNKTAEDLEYVVSRITKRSNDLKAMGYQYMYIPIPMQNALMSKEITPDTMYWETEFVRRLRENGVHSLNLLALFLEHKKEGLYFQTDTHWNARGVTLALPMIASYIQEHIPLTESAIDL